MTQDSQATLFDTATPREEPATPRCRMCVRPARWIPKHEQWGAYCGIGGQACNNRERICQSCSNPFHINVDGAGTKYCSTGCKRTGYTVALKSQPTGCAWCQEPNPAGTRARKGIWPYICQQCLDPIKHVVDRLKDHRVPHGRARQLLDNPGCEICGTDLVARRRESSTGKFSALLRVDHDHSCCPTQAHSCGKCVRGLLCHHCNVALGMMADDPSRLMAGVAYLTRSDLHK